MKVINRLIVILVGLAVFAAIVVAVILNHELINIMNISLKINYSYHSAIPSWGNLAILYFILFLAIIVVLAISFGTKKVSRKIIIPLLLVVVDLLYKNRRILLNFYNDVLALPNRFQLLANYGLENLFPVLSLIVVGLFFVFYFIVAIFNKTHKIWIRLVLLILGLAPIGLQYATGAIAGVYVPAYADIILMLVYFGIYLVVGLAVCLTHRNPNPKKRKVRQRQYENPKLPISKLTK